MPRYEDHSPDDVEPAPEPEEEPSEPWGKHLPGYEPDEPAESEGGEE